MEKDKFWQSQYFIVGTYAKEKEDSIFLLWLDAESGELSCEQAARAGEKTSWMQWDAEKGLLFVLNESEKYGPDENEGLIHSFHFKDGKFIWKNQQPSGGGLPVSLLYLPEKSAVLTANYSSGTVGVFPVNADGCVGTASDIIHHIGSGPDKKRQKTAHAHQVITSPDKAFIYVVDLGIDQIRSYHLDNGKLIPDIHDIAYHTTPGWGPRQMVFHPKMPIAFLIHEIESKISVLAFDPKLGTFKNVQDADCIPSDFKKENKCGAVHIHPSGKYVYVSNRGHNSIVCFPVEDKTGALGAAVFYSSAGDWPRHFCINPGGTFLISTNQKSDSISSFRIDSNDGSLHPTGFSFPVNKPVFADFLF